MELLSRLTGAKSATSEVEETLLSGWGRTAPTRATVAYPQTVDELLDYVDNTHPRGLIARGLGRSYGDPAQNAGGFVLDMTGLDDVVDVDLDAATITVRAGISIHRLMQLFVPLGLFVPVTPGTRYVTVGGAIASDIHGKNHHVDGTFGQHVEEFELLAAAGDILTVNRESQADLFSATCGGMGLTGLILTARIRMLRIPTSTVLVDTDRAANVDELLALMTGADDRYRYSVSWVDTLATGKSLGRGVLYRGNHLLDRETGPAAARLRGPTASRVSVPPLVPSGLVGLTSARLFNEIWFRKHPEREREQPQQLSAFFHQLDMVENTNRIYGHRGFVQHQCVLPAGEEQALKQILEILSGERVPTYLVVLKRMGPGNGLLSFPMAGWTLAVDIPAGWDGLNELLDRIDEIVVVAGGRLYLAKDSRMNPSYLEAMYPEIDRWRSIADRYDPERRFASDLSRRLGLRGERKT